MKSERYNINWDSYPTHLQEMLIDMKNTDELTDVTLVCDDKKLIKAHKIILSACSKVFKHILSSMPQQNTVIYLHGIQHTEVESLLDYMYLGTATLQHERMNTFLNIARNFEIIEFQKGKLSSQ